MGESFKKLPQLKNMRGKLVHDGWQPVYPVSYKTDIAIHHSLTDWGDSAAFARYHVLTNGWSEIAYAFVILKDGTIEWNHQLGVLSYHVGNSNKFAVGICLVGDFRDSEPTNAQKRSLKMLVDCLKKDLPNYKRTRGHDEFPGYSWKACPEFDYKAVINNSKYVAGNSGNKVKVNTKAGVVGMLLHLPKTVEKWRVYDLNVKPVKGNEKAFVKPKNFDGLTYEILGEVEPAVYVIDSPTFGKVKIYGHPDTGATITSQVKPPSKSEDKVEKTDWQKEKERVAKWAKDEKVSDGLRLDEGIKRIEAIVMLHRTADDKHYSDWMEGKYNAVLWAARNDISDLTRLNDMPTRMELLALIHRTKHGEHEGTWKEEKEAVKKWAKDNSISDCTRLDEAPTRIEALAMMHRAKL